MLGPGSARKPEPPQTPTFASSCSTLPIFGQHTVLRRTFPRTSSVPGSRDEDEDKFNSTNQLSMQGQYSKIFKGLCYEEHILDTMFSFKNKMK